MFRRLVQDLVQLRLLLDKLSRDEAKLSVNSNRRANGQVRLTNPAFASIATTRSRLLLRQIPIATSRAERRLPRLKSSQLSVAERQKHNDPGHAEVSHTAGTTDALSGPQANRISAVFSSDDALRLILALFACEEHRIRFVARTIREAERKMAASSREIQILRKAMTGHSRRSSAGGTSTSSAGALPADHKRDELEWHQNRRAASSREVSMIRSSVVSRPFVSAKMWRSLVDRDRLAVWLQDGGFSFVAAIAAKLPRLCLMLLRDSLQRDGAVNSSSPRFVVSFPSRSSVAAAAAAVATDIDAPATRGAKVQESPVDGSAQSRRKNTSVVKLLPRPAKAVDALAMDMLRVFASNVLPFLATCNADLFRQPGVALGLVDGFSALQQIASSLIVLRSSPVHNQELQRVLAELDRVLLEAATALASALASQCPKDLMPHEAGRLISAFSSLTMFEHPSGGAPLVHVLLDRMIPTQSTNTFDVLMAKGRSQSDTAFLSKGHRSHLRKANTSMVGGGRYQLSSVVEARLAQRRLKASMREARLQRLIDVKILEFAKLTSLSQCFSIFVVVAKMAPGVSFEKAHWQAVSACGFISQVMTLQLAESVKPLSENLSLANTGALLLFCSSLLEQRKKHEAVQQLMGFARLLLTGVAAHLSARLEMVKNRRSGMKVPQGRQQAGSGDDEVDDDDDDDESDHVEDVDNQAHQQQLSSSLPPSLGELSHIAAAISETLVTKAKNSLSNEARTVALLMKDLLLLDEDLWLEIADKRRSSEWTVAVSEMFVQFEMMDSALSAVLLGDLVRDVSKQRYLR